MRIETFELERVQSLWENHVEINLTESGIHPYTLEELLTPEQLLEIGRVRLGYGQTNGAVPFRRAISRLYDGADVDNVLVTNGSAEANFCAAWSLLEPGDEVVMMLPNYMQLWGVARSFGADVRPFHLRQGERWAPDLDELRSAVTPDTKMIAVCNPNNPTGAVLDAQEMREIARVAEEAGAWLYSDEIYRGAELNGAEAPSFFGLYERTVVAGGLSKAYALPGLRVGWLVGPEDMIADAWSYHDYTSITASPLGNRVGELALGPELRPRILERSRAQLRSNLAVLQDWLAKQDAGFVLTPPQAAGIAFIRYPMAVNSTELVTRLREEKSVLVIAGDCFGMDGHLRIGIGGERHELIEGLDRLGEFLRASRADGARA